MTTPRKNLIDDLVGDLQPVRRPGRVARDAASWLFASSAWVVLVSLATGPWRPGAVQALVAHPPYVLETGLAVLAIVSVAVAALRSAVPGEPGRLLRLRWLLPLAAWLAVYVVGLWYPPAYVSTLGGRFQCPLQVVLFSLPVFALLLWVARRQFPLRPRSTGFLCGVAAAAAPAAVMQFACVYTPAHVLSHHIAPIVVTAILGLIIGPVVLAVRTDAPRPRDASMH